VFQSVLQALLEDKNVDAVLAVLWTAPESYEMEWMNPSEIIKEAAAKFRDNPLVSWAYGPSLEERRDIIEATGNVLMYPTPERTIRALAALWRYQQIVRGK